MAAHLVVSLILYSFRFNTPEEPRALGVLYVSSKSASRVQDKDEEVAERNYRKTTSQ